MKVSFRHLLSVAAGALAAAACANASTPNVLLSTLHTFNGPNGSLPTAAPIYGPSGLVYGTTNFGGTSDFGTVYKMNAFGDTVILHSFNGTDGAYPSAGVTLGPHGVFFGTAAGGGDNDWGTVYRITAEGQFQLLHTFELADGFNPGPLLWADDGYLYGTTAGGGDFDYGTVFRISPSGELTTLYSFNQTDGYSPVGQLVPDRSGNLWGATQFGGAAQEGTIFRTTRDGNLTSLYTFTGGLDGGNVAQGLTLGCDGAVYGTTQYGGDSNQGTFFRMDASGTLTTLHSFSGTDGSFPGGGSPLLLGPFCEFFGLTEFGGAVGAGTLYVADARGKTSAIYAFPSQVNQAALQWRSPTQLYVIEATAGDAELGQILSAELLPWAWLP